MKIVKQTTFSEKSDFKNYQNFLDLDLKNIFLCFQGRVRFGTGVSGDRGENIAGVFVTFTSSTVVLSQTVISHTMSSPPIGWIVINNNAGGVLYTGTYTASDQTITLISTTTGTNYALFLLK